MRLSAFLAASLTATALACCNAPRQSQPAVDQPPQQSAAPSSFQMPEGAGCSGAVSRYKAVIENDLSMGHVNQSVYGQIQGEISEAAAACSSGQDAKAISLVRASKARHGYPGD
ncbi:hypothetical protein [Methylocystis iwaonis]|uniref:hypothetical protein n=1 Tax=Methylocystis iwaonis TaxID=2885079 RepID=UPI002E7B0B70|nr:hypothetical protein [Methylocystis iwaonis]